MTKPIILLDPYPRLRERILNADQWARLTAMADVIEDSSAPLRADLVDKYLPEASIVIGQTALSAERLACAEKLRAIVNVEGNFYPNVDYATCFARAISVLSIAPAFSVPVAEMSIAFALDLAREVTTGDKAMRDAKEVYGSAGNAGAVLLSGAKIGIVGYGNIGRALRRLLQGFGGEVRVFDPWLPDGFLRDDNVVPMPLEELLATSQFIFILAGVTSENGGFLGRKELAAIRKDAIVVLASRAGVVDFDAFVELAEQGHYRAATDVFPQEPLRADSPIRSSKLLLSAHRAGGMPASMRAIGEMIVDDVGLILRGLAPVRLQQARPETVAKLRSPPAQAYQSHTPKR